MDRDDYVKIDIPEPWSSEPARIHAGGIKAVALAVLLAAIIILALTLGA